MTKRSTAQYQGSIHSACRMGMVDATEAIAAKLRMWPTRRISSGQYRVPTMKPTK